MQVHWNYGIHRVQTAAKSSPKMWIHVVQTPVLMEEHVNISAMGTDAVVKKDLL